MRKYGYTITLGRINELPQVLESYREQKAKVKAVQDRRINDRVEQLLDQLRQHIEAVEIPIETGRAQRVLFLASSNDNDNDSIAIAKDLGRWGIETMLRADIRITDADENQKALEHDFDDVDAVTHRVFRLLYTRAKERFPSLYQDGNVKVQLKRARIEKINKGLHPESGEPVIEEREHPEHVIITISIPTRLLYPQQTVGQRKAAKRAASKRKARAEKG